MVENIRHDRFGTFGLDGIEVLDDENGEYNKMMEEFQTNTEKKTVSSDFEKHLDKYLNRPTRQQYQKWITIGGHEEGEKKHVEGMPIQIDESGNIKKGSSSLVGKNLGTIDRDVAGTKQDERRKPKQKPVVKPTKSPITKFETTDKWIKSISEDQKKRIFGFTEAPSLSQKEGSASYIEIRTTQKGVTQFLIPGSLGRIQESIEMINQALETAPKFKGVAYRGLGGIDEEDFKQLTKIGANITMDAFSSFTKKKTIAEDFITSKARHESKNIILKMENGGGVDISDLAASKGEEEILVQKGIKYKIKSTKDIYLEAEQVEITEVVLERIKEAA